MAMRILKLLDYPIAFCFWISIAAAFLMMVLVSLDVAGRGLFNHPIDGATEAVAAWFMVAVACLPWAWVARDNGHIVSDIVVRHLPPRVAFALEVFTRILTIAFLVVLCSQTAVRALVQTRAGEVWMAGADFIQVWPSRWLLPISSGLMCLYLVVQLPVLLSTGIQTKERGE